MPAPAKAVDEQVIWKYPEMQTFALSLIEHALGLLADGADKFTTDIVPDADRGDGPGVAGSVITMLKNASILEQCGVWAGPADARVFYAERQKSERDDSKGRWIGVYKLCSRSVAEEFLRRNQRPVQLSQPELAVV